MNKNEFLSYLKELDWGKTYQLQARVIPPFVETREISIRNLELTPNERGVEVGFEVNEESFICRFRHLSNDFVECWLEIFLTRIPSSLPDSFIEHYNETIKDSDVELVMRNNYIVLGCFISKTLTSDDLLQYIKTLSFLKGDSLRSLTFENKIVSKKDFEQVSIFEASSSLN